MSCRARGVRLPQDSANPDSRGTLRPWQTKLSAAQRSNPLPYPLLNGDGAPVPVPPTRGGFRLRLLFDDRAHFVLLEPENAAKPYQHFQLVVM